MPHDAIKIIRQDDIGIVLIDRAAKRNCLALPMWQALGEAFETLSAEDALRCVVLRGAGEEAFCAGADVVAFEHERGTPELEAVYARELGAAMQSVRACRHPVVAALSGWTMGGGCGLATMCDFRVGGENTRIGIPARNLGIWYAPEEIDPILQMVGYAVTAELLIEGRVFTGREAYEKGLLSRLVPDNSVQEEALALARRIATGAPLSARFHKRIMQQLRGPLPLSEADHAAALDFTTSEDFRNAVVAFREKRKPVFRGR